jgi:hypothetical protein
MTSVGVMLSAERVRFSTHFWRSQGKTEKNREENPMQTLQLDYLTAYRSLKLTRDANGVLLVEFHSNGGR